MTTVIGFGEEAPGGAGRFISDAVEPLRKLDEQVKTYSLAYFHDSNHPTRYTEFYVSGKLEAAFQKLGLDPEKLLNDLIEVYSESTRLGIPFNSEKEAKTIQELVEPLYKQKEIIRRFQLTELEQETVQLQRELEGNGTQ